MLHDGEKEQLLEKLFEANTLQVDKINQISVFINKKVKPLLQEIVNRAHDCEDAAAYTQWIIEEATPQIEKLIGSPREKWD